MVPMWAACAQNYGEHGRELITVEVALRLLQLLADPSEALERAAERPGGAGAAHLSAVLHNTVFKVRVLPAVGLACCMHRTKAGAPVLVHGSSQAQQLAIAASRTHVAEAQSTRRALWLLRLPTDMPVTCGSACWIMLHACSPRGARPRPSIVSARLVCGGDIIVGRSRPPRKTSSCFDLVL